MLKAHKLKILVGATSFCLLLAFSFGIVLKSSYSADEVAQTPSAPSNLTATELISGAIELNWQDNSSDETGFIIERAKNFERGFTTIATVNANITRYLDTQRLNNEYYYYKIASVKDSTQSIFSKIATPTRVEKKDYLLGMTDFEYSTEVYWQNAIDWAGGRSLPKADMAVANGWERTTGSSIADPDGKSIYRIAEGQGADGSNAQYMAIKNSTGTNEWNSVRIDISIVDSDPNWIHHGDSLNLATNFIKMDNFSNLPNGSTAKYSIHFQFRGSQITENPVNLAPSNTPFSNTLSDQVVPAWADDVRIYYRVYASGDIGSVTPGLYVDDVHLTAKRNGQDITENIPAPRERSINTYAYFYPLYQKNDLYETATRLDALIAPGSGNGRSMSNAFDALRYYHPNIKIYAYDISTISDYRSTENPSKDNFWYDKISVQLGRALANFPEAFVPYDPNTLGPISGDTRVASKRTSLDGITPLNYVFDDYYQYEYMVDISNPTFLNILKSDVDKTIIRDRVDGIFWDGFNERYQWMKYTGPGDPPDPENYEHIVNSTQNYWRKLVFSQTPDKMQQFSHNIMTYLHQRNVETMVNDCAHFSDTWPGIAWLDPAWNPANYDPAKAVSALTWQAFKGVQLTNNFTQADKDRTDTKYQPNTPENTPDINFNEYAFLAPTSSDALGKKNSYTSWLWLNSVQEMYNYSAMNTNLPEKSQKKIYQSVSAINRADDPAQNPVPSGEMSNLDRYDNGWLNFGLTSFLLGAGKNSWLGVISNGNDLTVNMDLPLTKKLGDPAADRIKNYSPDELLQTREFQNGLVTVNADPSQNREFTLPKGYLDDLGRQYPKDTKITLTPHSGRIFLLPPKPEVHITSPTEGATTKNPSVIVQYTVDGVAKERTFALAVGDNNLSITEANELESSVTSTVNFVIHRSDSVVLNPSRFAPGWNMAALPDIEESNPLADILPDTFKARTYNLGANKYDKFEETRAAPTLGQGYWMHIDDATKANAIRYSFNTRDSITTPVSKGWNLLGNPFQADLPLSSLTVKYKDGSSKPFSDAAIAKDIAGYVWSYEATDTSLTNRYYFISNNPAKYKTSAHKQTYISPFRGFWLVVRNDKVESIIMSR